jgi:uncharacterized membrane protein
MSVLRLRHALQTRFWIVPLLSLAAFLGLAIVTLAIDRAHDYGLVSHTFTGTPASVQHLLSTAAGALLSLSTVVLSLMLVAVQVAMGQFSPRIVRALLEDRRNQVAIGLFIGTFAYTMTVLREVDDRAGTVPGLSVLIAYALIVISVVALVLFVHQASRRLRVSGLIDLVGDATREQLERLAARRPAAPEDPRIVLAPAAGNVIGIDEPRLVRLARQADCRLELVPAMGEFVAGGAPLLVVHGRPPAHARVLDCVLLGGERTHEDDPAYGMRKLVDIALRAIASSPFDDPTTSVQALHRVHDCMRLLAARELPSGRRLDADGELRLVIPVLDWEGYVRLAFDELRMAGAGSPQVARRLRAALEDVEAIAAEDRRPPLRRQLELLTAAVARQYADDADISAALVADGMGIGSGRDVLGRAGAAG